MNLQPAPQTGAAPAETAAPTPLREFLAFKLGAEEYGIDILRVQEIRSYERPTRIAGTPDFVKGVINLRGVIVPIVDLRIKLRMDNVHYDAFTVVIVLNIGRRILGMVVDAVSDVITLQSEQLRPPPSFSAGLAGEHLLALATVEQRMLILVDIDKLLSGADIGLVEPTLQ
jgi:purine-binding chemotaxis protein CheW